MCFYAVYCCDYCVHIIGSYGETTVVLSPPRKKFYLYKIYGFTLGTRVGCTWWRVLMQERTRLDFPSNLYAFLMHAS